MLIFIIILELETTDKLVEFDDVLILKTMKHKIANYLGAKTAKRDTEQMRCCLFV